MKRSSITCCGLILTAGCIAGCESQPDTSPPMGTADTYTAPYNDPQIAVLSPQLRGVLAFSPAIIADDDERPMSVQVPVRNLVEQNYLIEYRLLFYDDNGIELDPIMGWKMEKLDSKQTVRLKGSAMSNKAKRYKVEVRWSQ